MQIDSKTRGWLIFFAIVLGIFALKLLHVGIIFKMARLAGPLLLIAGAILVLTLMKRKDSNQQQDRDK